VEHHAQRHPSPLLPAPLLPASRCPALAYAACVPVQGRMGGAVEEKRRVTRGAARGRGAERGGGDATTWTCARRPVSRPVSVSLRLRAVSP
jgi:hypothetical protein